MSVVVVGSVAIDTVETPRARGEEVLGGSALYFALAASFFAPVRLVAVVGEDFPAEGLAELRGRGIDLDGLEVRRGARTFRWHGRYHEDLNRRDTLNLELNVFADFRPRLPPAYREAPYLFLANIDPRLQGGVLDQLRRPALIAADTMTHWITETRGELEALLKRVEMLVINDEEARLLAGEGNLVRAARRLLRLGPANVLIKRGEYGVIHFSGDSIFALPAFPLEEVFDPTGAGDAFAGGLMGQLAATGERSESALRRAIVYGSVVASFVVEDFGPRRLCSIDREQVERRYRQFVALTSFDA